MLNWHNSKFSDQYPLILMQATNPLVDVEFISTAIHVFNNSSISKLVSINPYTCKRDGSLYITDDGVLYDEDMWVIYKGDTLNVMACDIDVWPDYCIARAISEGRVINVQ